MQVLFAGIKSAGPGGEGQTMRSISVYSLPRTIRTGPPANGPRTHTSSIARDPRTVVPCSTRRCRFPRALMSRGGLPRHYAYIRKSGDRGSGRRSDRATRERSVSAGSRLDRSATTVLRGPDSRSGPYIERWAGWEWPLLASVAAGAAIAAAPAAGNGNEKLKRRFQLFPSNNPAACFLRRLHLRVFIRCLPFPPSHTSFPLASLPRYLSALTLFLATAAAGSSSFFFFGWCWCYRCFCCCLLVQESLILLQRPTEHSLGCNLSNRFRATLGFLLTAQGRLLRFVASKTLCMEPRCYERNLGL